MTQKTEIVRVGVYGTEMQFAQEFFAWAKTTKISFIEIYPQSDSRVVLVFLRKTQYESFLEIIQDNPPKLGTHMGIPFANADRRKVVAFRGRRFRGLITQEDESDEVFEEPISGFLPEVSARHENKKIASKKTSHVWQTEKNAIVARKRSRVGK